MKFLWLVTFLLVSFVSHAETDSALSSPNSELPSLSTQDQSADRPPQKQDIEPSEPETSPGFSLITFETALNEIINRSTSVEGQRATLGQTKARNIPSKLSLLPTISLTGRHTQSLGAYSDVSTTGRAVEGTGRLNIFKFGADVAAMKAAGDEISQQEHLLNDTILKTEDTAVAALVNAIQTQQEVRIRNQILDVQATGLKIAQERYRQGQLPSQEVDKVSIDLGNTRASLSDARIRAARAKADLKALLGHDRIELEWPWREPFTSGNPKVPGSEETLRSRPDWQAAERAVEASEHRKNQVLGQVFPSLDVAFTYGRQYDVTPGTEAPYWSGTLSLSIPLFDRLSNYSNFRQAVYTKAANEAALEQVKRQARADWQALQKAFEISLDSARTRDNNLIVSRNLYRDNLRRYHRGLVTANDLILDQTRLFNTELFAVNGWAAVHQNYSSLCHAMGFRVKDCRTAAAPKQASRRGLNRR